jgi:hypothetical protein
MPTVQQHIPKSAHQSTANRTTNDGRRFPMGCYLLAGVFDLGEERISEAGASRTSEILQSS